METGRLKKHLQSVVHFANEEMESLVPYMEIYYLKKKDHLFRQGEIDRYVGFVNKGCLRYYYMDEKGHEHILYFALEEWWIGDLNSFYLNEPTPNSLQALEDCELFLFSLHSFESARKQIPAFNDFITIKHRKAYTSSQQRSFESKVETAEEKYRKLLASSPDIFQRIPQHYIAAYLGIAPESLSRIRKKISNR